MPKATSSKATTSKATSSKIIDNECSDNECSICAEEYNKSNRSQICCEYCDMNACRSCCERYILGESVVKCMNTNCGRPWSRKFIENTFTKTFNNGPLKTHRQNILFEKEKQHFPEVIQKMAVFEPIKKDLNSILSCKPIQKDTSLYNTILYIYNMLFENIIPHNIQANINFIHIFLNNIDYHSERIFYLMSKEHEIAKEHEIDNNNIVSLFNIVSNELLPSINNNSENIKKQIEKTNQCLYPDCKGILDAKWYCILCKNTTCSSCLEIKKMDDEHKCNPDTVKTVEMIKMDTKPCPKCKTNIYKIDGCDQMWCVKCHTAFSWMTGAIEKRIHNPHYYEWMRKNQMPIPRNDTNNNNICDENVELNEEHANILYRTANSMTKEQKYAFEKDIRHLIELREFEVRKYMNTNNNQHNMSRFIMTQNYLRNNISEKEYKSFLFNEDQERECNFEVYQLIQTWIIIKTDILRRLLHQITNANENCRTNANGRANDGNDYHSIRNEMNNLVDFVKNNLTEIEKTYKRRINIPFS